MFERFNVVPPARVLPVQNSQGTVSCRGSVPRKKCIRATTRYTEYCRRPEKLLCRSPKSVPPFKISPSPHKNAAKKMQLHSAEENAAKKIHFPSGYTFVSKKSIFLREYPYACRRVDILGKAATPLSLSNSFFTADSTYTRNFPTSADKLSIALLFFCVIALTYCTAALI